MKTYISNVGLIVCLAVGAAAQRYPTADTGSGGANQRNSSEMASKLMQGYLNQLGSQDQNAIEATRQPDLNTEPGTTVSVSELQHKVPGRALKESNKGLKAAGKGDYEVAVDHFQKAVDIDPEFADGHNDLGVGLAKLGHLDQAADQLRKALELSPNHSRAAANLSLVLLRSRQYHEAGVAARRALKIDPRDVQICYVLAVALFAENGDNDEALYNLRRAAVQFPRARLMASEILVETGRPGEAAQQLEEYLRSTPKEEPNRPRVEARLAQLRQ